MLTNLTVLDMSCCLGACPIDDEGISTLIGLVSLRCCSSDQITDEGIKWLTNLTELTLPYFSLITEVGIRHLTKLRTLHANESRCLSDADILGLTNLTDLNYDEPYHGKGRKFSNTGMSFLSNLHSLSLYGCKFLDQHGLKNLRYLTSLTLSLTANRFPDECFQRLTTLKILRVRSVSISDKGILGLTNLTSLTLRVIPTVTDFAIRLLTNLTTLTLDQSRISYEGISGLRNLTHLEVTDCCNLSHEGRLSELPNLVRLFVDTVTLFGTVNPFLDTD